MYVGRIVVLALMGAALLLGGLLAGHFFKSAPEPSDAHRDWILAQKTIASRDFSQAVVHLTTCLQSCPFNAETHFLMARTCRRAGWLKDWKTHLQEAAFLQWPMEQIDFEKQLQRAQIGDVWNVEDSLLEQLNNRPPEEPLILEALVNGLVLNDRLTDVVLLTTKWNEAFPEDWLPLIYRGNARLRLNGKTEDVIDDFKRVLELKPDDVEANLALAMVLANNGDVGRAFPHFKACRASMPDDPRVLFGIAYCQHSLGMNQEARVTLSQLLDKIKDHAAGCFLQAKIELAEDFREQAYQWLKKADRLSPKEVDVTNALMLVCRQLGRTEEAEEYRRSQEEIRARDAELDKLATALKSRPEDAALRFQLGMACLKLGRDLEATHWFQGILWKDPAHLSTLKALADFYEKKGNRKMADHFRLKAENAIGRGIVKTP